MRHISLMFISVLLLTILLIGRTTVHAQGTVECGDITQGEFTQPNNHVYFGIFLKAGSGIWVNVKSIGSYLRFNNVGMIIAPSGSWVAQINITSTFPAENEGSLQTGVLGETGEYTIELSNRLDTGAFTMEVGCMLPEGTVIKPGDKVIPTLAPTIVPTVVPPSPQTNISASGVGFPGLPSVDFSSASSSNLPSDGKFEGQIKPTSKQPIVFTFAGKADNSVNFNFIRESGNLNLGVVILSPDNKVIFQTSLVASQTLSTQLILPSAGQYTVGIFPIDLTVPNNPVETQFQLNITFGS